MAEEPGQQPSGCCVEVAELPGGAIAVRNSVTLPGQPSVYTRAEIGRRSTGRRTANSTTCNRVPAPSLPSGRRPPRFRMAPTLARDRCRPGQRGAVWRLHTECLVWLYVSGSCASFILRASIGVVGGRRTGLVRPVRELR